MHPVLVNCEYSQRVAAALRKRGVEAYSCDLLDTEGNPDWHIKGDAIEVAYNGVWGGMIAHPDCTYLTGSAEWAYRDEQTKKMAPDTLFGAARREAREKAIEFVLKLANANIDMIAIENPIGVLSTVWREPDQYIQPYEYGEDASKNTCLWLKNLPLLKPTGLFPPRLVLRPNGKGYTFRWGNQTDSGQNKLTPSGTRGLDRAKTYQGWADAFADQWGPYFRGEKL